MSENKTVVNFPIFGLLGIVFVTLKLCGVINWSWWWVTCPFWGGLALVFGIAISAAIFGVIILGVAAIWEWFKFRK